VAVVVEGRRTRRPIGQVTIGRRFLGLVVSVEGVLMLLLLLVLLMVVVMVLLLR
jgi:hypothetical protein